MYRLTGKEIEAVRERVHAYTPEGFVLYWHVVNSLPMPEHVVGWTIKYFDSLKDGKDLALEAFRGSIKTTFVSNLVVYTIGCKPHLEHLIMQGGDVVAEENTSFIADIIENNPGFKILFPGIRPDTKKWGAEGYEVVDTSQAYGTWRRKRTKVPTLVGGGYKSTIVLGKHPRGLFIRDDINNYKNTRSARELKAVKDIVFKEMGPAADRSLIEIDVFTPWVQGDVGDVRKGLTNVRHIRTPIYKLDENGELTDEPTWPEVFPEERIQQLRDTLPPVEFAQMYLCDPMAAKGQKLKREWLHFFPHEEIQYDRWPAYLGVDYASVASKQLTRGRDFFALSVLLLHPSNFLILIDGVRKHVLRAEAEDVLLNMGDRFSDQVRVCRIEKLGSGADFANWALSNAPFRVKEGGVSNKDKGFRFEYELAPVFRGMKVRVSDEPGNAYIQQFMSEWLAYDGMDSYSDDTLDATWHGVAAAKNFIKLKKEFDYDAKVVNPYAGFAA